MLKQKRIHDSVLHLCGNYLQLFPMSAFKCTVFLLDVFVSSIFQVRMASEDSSFHCYCAVIAVRVPDVSKDRSTIIFRGLLHPQIIYGLHPITPNNRTLNMKKEDQQVATIRCLLLTSVSTCFGHHYVHLQEKKGPITVFGVSFCL